MECQNYTDKITGCLLSVTARYLHSGVTQKVNEGGWNLAFEQLQTLFVLWCGTSINQNDLAELLGKDKTTVSRIVESLVKKGFVERHPSPEDRRVNIISLTSLGVDSQASIKGLAHEFLDEILHDVSEEDLEITHKTLQKMLTHLKKGK